MVNNDDSIQNRCLLDILENYPKEFHAILLKEMPELDFEEDADSTDGVLESVWEETRLAEKFMDIFDGYENKGRTHIFFYRLNDKEYLEKLRDENKLKTILPAAVRDLINEKIFLWDSPGPQLVNIRHQFNDGRGELVFKWVESRFWDERIAGGTIRSSPRYVRRKERSVNYFIVDLSEEIAQLRIQLIKPNALQSLKGEYDIYLEEIKKLIGFNKFRRIALESVIKSFLSDKVIDHKSWEGWLPDGGCFTAKGTPQLYAKFLRILSTIRLMDFFARKLNFEYQPKKSIWGSPIVKLKLDGEKDMLTIYSACEQQQMAAIINKVLGINESKIRDKIISNFQKRNHRFDLERIALSFDYHFRRLKKKEVTAGHLMNSEWLQKNRVFDAMKLLGDGYPNNFGYRGSGKDFTLFRKP